MICYETCKFKEVRLQTTVRTSDFEVEVESIIQTFGRTEIWSNLTSFNTGNAFLRSL